MNKSFLGPMFGPINICGQIISIFYHSIASAYLSFRSTFMNYQIEDNKFNFSMNFVIIYYDFRSILFIDINPTTLPTVWITAFIIGTRGICRFTNSLGKGFFIITSLRAATSNVLCIFIAKFSRCTTFFKIVALVHVKEGVPSSTSLIMKTLNTIFCCAYRIIYLHIRINNTN